MKLKRDAWERVATQYRVLGLEEAALTIERAMQQQPTGELRVTFRWDATKMVMAPDADQE